MLNFAPRVGLAWDVTGDGRTALRAGFGIFDVVPLPYLLTNRAGRAAPFFTEAIAPNPPSETFPNNVLDHLRASPGLRQAWVEFDPSRPHRRQWNLNLQREIVSNVIATIGYVGSAARNLPQSVEDHGQVSPELVTRLPDGRYQFPTTGPIQRSNPYFGRVAGSLWRTVGDYHALQVNVAKRLSQNWSGQINYTWSRSLDNGTATFSDAEFSNTAGSPWPFDQTLNRGVSDFDLTHVFSANFRWSLPSPDGAARAILGGWEVAGILSASSGGAFSVLQSTDRARTGNSRVTAGNSQRPDFAGGDGCDNAVTGDPDQHVKLECFAFPPLGVLGNLGRNTLRVPAVVTFDFSTFKNFQIAGDGVRLQLRAEFFNLFNRVNFVPAVARIFDGAGRYLPRAGQLNQLGFSRKVQFGVKVLW